MTKLVRPEFADRMEWELQENSHKGDWRSWSPNELEAIGELTHHLAKLIAVMNSGNKHLISEYSADIANIAMKIEEVYGQNI